MPTNSSIKTPRQHSIQTIHQFGGRLVLLQDYPASDRRAKQPLSGIPWKLYQPTLDVLLSHPGRLGLVPSSIDCTALDVDQGNPISLPAGWVDYPSRLPGRFHKWYQETQQFKDCKWEGAGCSGEIRHKGYLVPWGNGIHRIAKAILAGRQILLFPFPSDIIREIVRERDAELYNPDKERTVQVPRSLWYEGMPLEEVRKGARGIALFSTLRKWAYGQTRGLVLSDWKAHVLDECYAMNQCFDAPIRSKQVRDCAYSVSVWVWSNMVDYGRYRTPELQSARGRRRRELQRKGTPLENDRQPWLKLGISKAWWYRKYRHAQE